MPATELGHDTGEGKADFSHVAQVSELEEVLTSGAFTLVVTGEID